MKKILIPAFFCVLILIFLACYVKAQDSDVFQNSNALFKEVQLFADAITIVNSDYVEPVEVKTLIYGAIRGMMATLDGYSQFLEPESFQEITEVTKGEFAGIGIEIGMPEGVPTVIAPIEDTPAFAAGLKSGDKIVKIDGMITSEMSMDDVVKNLRGDIGSEVKLIVIREGEDRILDFVIIRAIIKLKSIKEAAMIEEGIGYIKIVEFQKRTGRDFNNEVKSLTKNQMRGLIVDLRNNPGGLLESAIETADVLLDQGVMIVYTEGRNADSRLEVRAEKDSQFDDIVLAVLVNEGSASASEIFAGAMKDNKRGVIVGVPTFGKGSVQMVIPLEDNSAIRLTTAAYFTPRGESIRDKGIQPDIFVEKIPCIEGIREEGPPESTVYSKVSPKNGEEIEKDINEIKYDNQLQAAINILKGMHILQEYKELNSIEKKKVE